MPRSTRSGCLIAVGCIVLASCAGDDARKHVYQSPPPVRATPPSASASPPATPEPPIGAAWATAKINSVRLASTGAIASLGDITDSIDVLAMVSRGKGSSSAGPARIELHFAGPTDTTLVERVEAPVPLVVAHVFRVDAAHGPAGLHDGAYRAQLRLLGPDGRVIAQSIPLSLSVRGK